MSNFSATKYKAITAAIFDQICQQGSYTHSLKSHFLLPFNTLSNVQWFAFTEASFTGLSAFKGAQVAFKWLQLAWPSRQLAGNHQLVRLGIDVATFYDLGPKTD